MADQTITDELTTAAARLRETAADATPGPWGVGNGEVIGLNVEQTGRGSFRCSAQLARVLDDTDREEYADQFLGSAEGDASWIALASPALAEPLAKWLESWTGIEIREDGPMAEDLRHALAIARVINGSAPA